MTPTPFRTLARLALWLVLLYLLLTAIGAVYGFIVMDIARRTMP